MEMMFDTVVDTTENELSHSFFEMWVHIEEMHTAPNSRHHEASDLEHYPGTGATFVISTSSVQSMMKSDPIRLRHSAKRAQRGYRLLQSLPCLAWEGGGGRLGEN